MNLSQIQSAYDGYPVTSTVIFLFAVLLAFVFFKFGNRAIQSFQGFYRRLLPAYGVVLLLLLVNVLLALSLQSTLQAIAAMPPVSSSGLRELGKDRVAVLTGIISPENSRTSVSDQEYVAFIGDRTWRPVNFLVENQGEAVLVSDRGYAALNWPRHRDSFGDNSVRYLDHGQSVVVVGKIVASTQRPFSSSNADTNYGLDARVVYAGSHAAFVTATERRALWPRIMLGLNSFALGAVGLGVVISSMRRLMQRGASQKS